jgi:hypothetical protein
MSETRPPEAMPTEWRIASFSSEQGFGTLIHESDEQVIFNIDAWDLGDWKPPRNEVYFAIDGSRSVATQPGNALLPTVGERVRVRWKRSRTGKNVPALVQPMERVSVEVKAYKLGAWLKGIQSHAGCLLGLTSRKLVAALATLDNDVAEGWREGEAHEGSDFVFLLKDLAAVVEVDLSQAKHFGWIYSDDHRWDRERAQRTVATMLGLREPIPTAGDGYTTGTDESLPDYVTRCNAIADEQGCTVRLRELNLEGDAHVFIAVTDEAFDALTKGGYVIA